METVKTNVKEMTEDLERFFDEMFDEEKLEKTINPQFEGLKDPQKIISHIQELKSEVHTKTEHQGLFVVKSGNEWLEEAKQTAMPKMHFGELWFENELCILFADTNLGKSILAVQIGNSISKGEQIEGFRLESEKQDVLYFDFELTKKQFEVRYSMEVDNKILIDHYPFDEGFKRVEINPDANYPPNIPYEDFLINSFEREIERTGIKVVIVDNITFLGSETEKAKYALPLIKKLKDLKTKYNLSMMVLAHTPKRDLSKPLSVNDLAGSKQLINFADSVFAIGANPDGTSTRYIKQIKVRNTEKKYGANNVITCKIDKPYNFLEFQFVGYDMEHTHLKTSKNIDWDEQRPEVLQLKEQGVSNVKIAESLGVSESLIRKKLKKWESE